MVSAPPRRPDLKGTLAKGLFAVAGRGREQGEGPNNGELFLIGGPRPRACLTKAKKNEPGGRGGGTLVD